MPRNDFGADSIGDLIDEAERIADRFEEFSTLLRERFDEALADANEELHRLTEEYAPRADESDEDYHRPDGYTKLHESVDSFRDGLLRYRVVVDHPAARPQEYGAAPHTIRAKQADYLRFKVNGSWVTTVEVRHPGNDPQPFLDPAIRDVAKGLRDRLLDVFDETKRDVFG
jgi:hypothetical protein